MSERKARAFQRREKEILRAALELFDDEQWEKVTVAQIAQRADIGKGTVYKHFSSKEEIYARLILDDSLEMLKRFGQHLQEGDDPVTKIRNVLNYSFQKLSEDNAITRLHFHCKQRSFRERLSESIQQQFEKFEQDFMAEIAPVIEQGMAQGDFMSRPLHQTFAGLEAIFDGSLLMIRNGDYVCSQIDPNT